MEAKKFKELCRRILHLEPNGWHTEMPDNWRMMICTRHGVEPMGSWFDEPHNKQILLCGESADRDEPIWHEGKDLPKEGEWILVQKESLADSDYLSKIYFVGVHDGERICGNRQGDFCLEMVDRWAYVKDLL